MQNIQTINTILMTSPHLATNLIGTRYENGGKSLKGFDCWGLVWYFFNELGIETPMPTEYETRTTNNGKNQIAQTVLSKHLEPIENPKQACVVLFNRAGLTIHAGVWIPELKKVLHCVGKMGVVLEHLQTAEMTRGIKGKLYQWV